MNIFANIFMATITQINNSIIFFFAGVLIVSLLLHFIIRKHYNKRISYLFVTSLFILYVFGFLLSIREGDEVESEMQQSLIRQVKALAENIDSDDLLPLKFSKEDFQEPSYQRLNKLFEKYAKSINVLGIYTLAKKGDSLVFGPESYSQNDPMASPPGTVYSEATEELINLFDNGIAFVEGPVKDKYGVFVSALAPVFFNKSDEILMVIGVDVDAKEWISVVERFKLIVFFKFLLLGIILLLGDLLYEIKHNAILKNYERLKYVETYFITIFCLVITYLTADYLKEDEIRQERKSFSGLAKISFMNQLKSLRDLNDYEIGGLERFFKGSQFVSEEEFLSYTEPIIKQKWIESINWTEIKVLTNNNNNISNLFREGKFPIKYVQSSEDKRNLKGKSIVRNNECRILIEEALNGVIPTSTLPYYDESDSVKRMKVSVFFPVVKKIEGMKEILGIVTIVLNSDMFVKDYNKNDKPYTELKLYPLLYNHQEDFVKVEYNNQKYTWGMGSNLISKYEKNSLSIMYPLFIFGNAYTLIVSPDQTFLLSLNINSLYLAAIIGMVLTFLIATITVVFIRRGSFLKEMVNERTEELRKSEVSLRKALLEAENANIEKDKFFSIIAHDLKTPFSGLLGFLQLLLDDDNGYPEAQRKKLLNLLFESSKNLYTLLENLLQWSRIKRGMIQPTFTSLNLTEVIEEVIKLLETSIEKKGILIQNEVKDISVTTDVQMVNLVIRNLLSNAIKFSNRGSKIVISVSENENELVIKVKDEGIGMDSEILSNIFKLGTSVGRSGTEGELSTGLGLILCKEYLEKLGGTMWAVSEKNVGSEFYFSLPKKLLP